MIHVRLDFGKHNGRRVQDVPTGYLRWCLRECECLTPRQRQAVAEELARRDAGRHPGPPPGLETDYPPPVDWSPLIRRWHRELVLRWHPDRGGSTEGMKAVNDAYELLRELTGVA